MHKKKTSNPLKRSNPIPHIPRSPDEGAYRRDWRWQAAQHYLAQLKNERGEAAEQLASIWTTEPDEAVLLLLLYECGAACRADAAISYAVSCQRDNAQTRLASKIKAFVLAKLSEEQIADALRTKVAKIEMFEWLFFDVRPYLKNTFLINEICACNDGSPECELERYWFQVARDRGYKGLRQLMLGEYDVDPNLKRWPPEFSRIAQIALQRGSDYFRDLQIRGHPLSEQDLEAISVLPKLVDFADTIGSFRLKQPEQPVPKAKSLEGCYLETIETVRCLLLIQEHLCDPCPKHFEQFQNLKVFKSMPIGPEGEMESIAADLLLEVLSEANPLIRTQLERLQLRVTEQLYDVLVSAAALEEKEQQQSSPPVGLPLRQVNALGISWPVVRALVDQLSSDPNYPAVRRTPSAFLDSARGTATGS
jgi:hypothetical protein